MGMVGIATLGLVLLSALWAGTESDSAALERQRQLVTQRLHAQVDQVAEEIDNIGSGYVSFLANGHSETPADAGVIPAIPKNDGAAASAAISMIVTSIFGYDRAFVVDGTGELAMVADPDSEKKYRWTKPLLMPMLREFNSPRQVGREERRSVGSSSKVFANGAFADLMRLEGRPTIAGIVPISSSSGPQFSDGGRTDPKERRYLIAIRFVDGAILDDLSQEQGLHGARFARSADPDENEVAYQIDAGVTGEPIGFIVWSPDLPGSRVIGRLLPTLSVAAFITALLFLVLLGRLRRGVRELEHSETTARHLARHDVLTSLPNRAYFSACFEECLSEMRNTGKRHAIALIDLDRFKAVNDSFGHAAGDELIRTAAGRMNTLARPSDTLARLGGDEFALLLRDIGDDDEVTSHICVGLLAELNKPFVLRGGEIEARVGGSIGLALLPDFGGNASDILRQADVALYEAKHTGRGRWVRFEPSIETGRDSKETLKCELRLLLAGLHFPQLGETNALGPFQEANPGLGKLELHYQTVHSAAHGNAPSGAEAFVRWRHPVHGLLVPSSFVPLAEESGLIEPLGRWVLNEACRAAVEWPSDTCVSVNVSPSQLRSTGFEEDVDTVLRQTGLAPWRLEIEVTEAALTMDGIDVKNTLRRLRARRVKILLDDFGSGPSSLSHLVQFDIDRVKIDSAFLSLLASRGDGASIVSALIGLGRTMGIATTAAGVETDTQRDFLVALGCEDLQGYFFSRPVRSEDLTIVGNSVRP